MLTVAGASSSRANTTDHPLLLTDVEFGRILWLPPKTRVETSLRRHDLLVTKPVTNVTNRGNNPNAGFYDHPILVISEPSDSSNRIYFLLLTTFKDTDIERRFDQAENIWRREEYLAIHPSRPHPLEAQGYRTLRLSRGGADVKPGYVKISAVYSVDWRAAEHFWAGKTPRVTRAIFATAEMAYVLSHVRRSTASQLPRQHSPLTPAVATHPAPPIHIRTTSTVISNNDISHGRVDSLIADLPSTWSSVPPERLVDVRTSQSRLLATSRHQRDNEQRPLLPRYNPATAPKRHDELNGFFAWLWDYLKRTRLGIIVRYVFCL